MSAIAIISEVCCALDPVHADTICYPITVPTLEIGVVDCAKAQVWVQLEASRMFPDVFAGSGKMTNVCYAAAGPAPAMICNTPVTITSSLSGWTTDFTPVLIGGKDNLGTVVTRLTISVPLQSSPAEIFTRDTIDFSQIATTGIAPEEDVIVGGTGWLRHAKGTWRVAGASEDPQGMKVKLTNLAGLLCLKE